MAPVPAAEAVRAENAHRGTPDWPIRHQARPYALNGWVDRVSVASGESVRLYVSTAERSYRVSAFRMGWYAGAQARLVYRSNRQPGRRQHPFRLAAHLRTVSTDWTPALAVNTHGWVPGDYLFRLDGESGAQSYIPLTVRSPDTAGRLLIVNAVTTWQAYNHWGGYSLYAGPTEAGFAGRARAVSFDRPYDGAGDGRFLLDERPLVALVERLGLPVAYITDVDLHEHPELLHAARALVSLGHDEYWSARMRNAVLTARGRGLNLAFLGSNAAFHHIRLASTTHGFDRLMICYKRAREDPLRRGDPADVTVPWRWSTPRRPDSQLTGEMYESNPVTAAGVINDPGGWLLRGLGYHMSARIPGLVQREYDRVNPGQPLPGPVEVITHSPVTCRGVRSYADAAYASTPNGAGVFDAGTMAWVRDLQATNTATRTFVTAVTTRLLTTFAAGPAGRLHPAHSNLTPLHEYTGDPIAARKNLW